jgi:hypothetical protein
MRNTRGLKRGGPGRTLGVPNKATLEAKEFCRGLISDPEYQTKFVKAWRARRLPPGLESMVWSYAFGRPSQYAEVSERPLSVAEILAGHYREDDASS